MTYVSTEFGEYAIEGRPARLATALQRDLAVAQRKGSADRAEVIRYLLSRVLGEHGRRAAVPIRREVE
ncbi:MAG: hypothetical protein IT303_06035 [Dehalococcoidia bacterium]|nr:hypothetical protein [Dehalococcoidia bacterium]